MYKYTILVALFISLVGCSNPPKQPPSATNSMLVGRLVFEAKNLTKGHSVINGIRRNGIRIFYTVNGTETNVVTTGSGSLFTIVAEKGSTIELTKLQNRGNGDRWRSNYSYGISSIDFEMRDSNKVYSLGTINWTIDGKDWDLDWQQDKAGELKASFIEHFPEDPWVNVEWDAL